MHIFKDKEGTEWVIDLSLGTAKQIEAYDFAPAFHVEGPVYINFIEPDEKLFTELITQTSICFGMIWCCCRKQAEARGINNELEFFERFDGEAVERAKLAFYEELPLFFSNRKTSLQSLIGTYLETQKMLDRKLQQMIPKVLSPEKMEAVVDRELEKMQKEVEEALAK